LQPIRDFHFQHHGGLDTLVRCASATEGILFSLELQSLEVAFKNEDEIKVFLEELEKENDFSINTLSKGYPYPVLEG